MSYAVCVTFVVAPEHADAFRERVAAQARDSRAEPGCRAFDAWSDAGRPHAVFLYEVYDDRAAFEAHLATPHFAAFDRDIAAWVRDKRVETHDRRIDDG